MSALKSLGLLLISAMMLGGCGAGIEGDWQSREKLSNKKRNELEVLADGSVELKMYTKLAPTAGLSKLKFKGDWTEDGEEFEFEFKCDSGCPADSTIDFEMDCTIGENQALDCEAKAPFAEYGYFEFEPITE